MCAARSEFPPSKYMTLGSGLSSMVKSPLISCFDVELYAEEDMSTMIFDTEDDFFALFGFSDAHHQCSNKMGLL